MRIPNEVHTSRPWRIREIAPDFTVEDVWALPAHGRAEEFPALVELTATSDPADSDSLPARALWLARDLLGRWFGLGRVSAPDGGRPEDGLPIPGASDKSLTERLPDDLRDTVSNTDFDAVPFTPLYRTDREFAAEVSNQTVHGVLHLSWVDQGGGRYQGHMAVYVKPRGLFGKGYLAFIKPFRYLIVYPALMRKIERTWETRGPAGEHSGAGGPA
jgi:hypothetical protein